MSGFAPLFDDAPPTPPVPPVEVVVYGTICLDRFIAVDTTEAARHQTHIAEPDAAAVREMAGGEAFNTAIALAGWGVCVALTGTAIGDDADGLRLRSLLAREAQLSPSLHTGLVVRDPAAMTPACTIRVTPDGERYMSGKGFDRAVAPPVEPLLDLLRRSPFRPIFAVDPNLRDAAVDAALAASHMGCPVVAMDFAHIPEVARAVRILVTSRDVLLRSRRLSTASAAPDALKTEARRLFDEADGKPMVILTMGADGCLVADGTLDEVCHFPAVPAQGVVDTTGAGDTFRAGLCYALLRGLPLPEMIRFAGAAAALHCEVRGGGSRFPLARVRERAASAVI